jgi:hypothetical protein
MTKGELDRTISDSGHLGCVGGTRRRVTVIDRGGVASLYIKEGGARVSLVQRRGTFDAMGHRVLARARLELSLPAGLPDSREQKALNYEPAPGQQWFIVQSLEPQQSQGLRTNNVVCLRGNSARVELQSRFSQPSRSIIMMGPLERTSAPRSGGANIGECGQPNGGGKLPACVLLLRMLLGLLLHRLN